MVETVGAGQSEVEIVQMADTTVVVVAPGLGDDIQAIKAGILEIADLFVVNKADRPGVDKTVAALRMTPVIEQVNIPFYQQFIDDDGVVQANEVMEQAADAMLDQLVKLEAVLRPLRDQVASAG